MALALDNIKSLANSLRENNWYITAFPFDDFYNHDYAVVLEDLRTLNMGSRYYGIELTFIDMADETRRLTVRANAYGINHLEESFAYFGINRNGNGKYPQYSIYNSLNEACPPAFVAHPAILREHILNATNLRDRDHGNGLCCYMIKRNGNKANGEQIRRSPYNTAKTRLLRESLFNLIGKKDDTISFCYRENNPLTDVEIIHNYNHL